MQTSIHNLPEPSGTERHYTTTFFKEFFARGTSKQLLNVAPLHTPSFDITQCSSSYMTIETENSADKSAFLFELKKSDLSGPLSKFM